MNILILRQRERKATSQRIFNFVFPLAQKKKIKDIIANGEYLFCKSTPDEARN